MLKSLQKEIFRNGNPLPGHRERTVWYVVYRVLDEEGLLGNTSERQFTKYVDNATQQGWGYLGFRNVPSQLKYTPLRKWPSLGTAQFDVKPFVDLAKDVKKHVNIFLQADQKTSLLVIRDLLACRQLDGGVLLQRLPESQRKVNPKKNV